MFVDPALHESAEYRALWAKLGRREFDAATYKRIGKGGRVVYIQASYNPIFDTNGKPYKVVKVATDVTQLQMAVQQTQSVVNAAIDGNLLARVPMEGKSGVNKLLEATTTLVRRVKTASSEVRVGAVEISTGNTNLSQRTEEQASSLEQIASSMEQMTPTVKQTADNAALANQLAGAAREQAEKGGSIECGGGGGPRRRTGPRFCRGRQRGAQSCRPQPPVNRSRIKLRPWAISSKTIA